MQHKSFVLILGALSMFCLPFSVSALSDGFEYVHGKVAAKQELLVQLKPGKKITSSFKTEEHIASARRLIAKPVVDGKFKDRYVAHSLGQLYTLELDGTESVETALERLRSNPRIAAVEPNYEITLTTEPNDPYFDDADTGQWSFHNHYLADTNETLNVDSNMLEAWTVTTGSDDVVVGVIDTGIDYTHEDIDENIWHNPGETAGDGIDNDGNGYIDDVYGWDFADNDNNPSDGGADFGHGTAVASIIGAEQNNSTGTTGVSPHVRLAAMKIANSSGGGSPSSAAMKAIAYSVVMDFPIVNGSYTHGENTDCDDLPVTCSYYQALNDNGTLVVVASGNDSNDLDTTPSLPGSFDGGNFISVTGTTSSGAQVYNYGATTVDLGAGAYEIPVIDLENGGYKRGYGTSYAAPQVAGAAALLLATDSSMTATEVKDQLLSTVDPVTALSGKTVTGGRLDAGAALGVANHQPAAFFTVSADSTNTGESLSFNASSSKDIDGDTLTYKWNFGDGHTSTSRRPSHAFDISGTYAVVVTVSDGIMTDSFSRNLTIYNAPTARLSADTSLRAGVDSGLFDASASSDADGDTLTYAWDFGDGTTFAASTLSTKHYTYTSTGTYTVTVTISDGRSTATATQTVEVYANTPPVVTISATTSTTMNEWVSFTGSATDADGDTVTYAWDFGDGDTSRSNPALHYYTEKGDFSVALTVSDGIDSTTVRHTITIANRAPDCGMSITRTTGSLMLTAKSSSSDDDITDTLSSTWDMGDGSAVITPTTSSSVTYTYATAGAYTISLTVSDGEDATTCSRTVTVGDTTTTTTTTTTVPPESTTPSAEVIDSGDGVSISNDTQSTTAEDDVTIDNVLRVVGQRAGRIQIYWNYHTRTQQVWKTTTKKKTRITTCAACNERTWFAIHPTAAKIVIVNQSGKVVRKQRVRPAHTQAAKKQRSLSYQTKQHNTRLLLIRELTDHTELIVLQYDAQKQKFRKKQLLSTSFPATIHAQQRAGRVQLTVKSINGTSTVSLKQFAQSL